MKRLGPWLGLASALVLTSLAAGCSKPSADASPSASPVAATPPPPAASLASAPSVDPSLDSLLTPEDAEDAAEHRITEQNLESELDRLEREIQAE